MSILYKQVGTSSFDTLCVGHYKIKMPITSKNVIQIIDFDTIGSINGEYSIIKLNEDILVLLEYDTGIWEYREFVKSE